MNFTDDAPSSALPWIVAIVPHTPDVGLKLPTAGTADALTVKTAAEAAVPPAVVTVTGPVMAPFGASVLAALSIFDRTDAAPPRP